MINADLGTRTGLVSRLNLEIGNQVFFDVELTHKITRDIALGAYYRNFNTIKLGLDSRISDTNYGLIFKYNSLTGIFLDAQIGMGDNGFDASIQGGVKFRFE